MKEPFIKVGERVRFIGTGKHRRGDWPEGKWLEYGVTGTVTEYHPEQPAVIVRGERFEALPPYAVVTWDLGEEAKTCIDVDNEGSRWERVETGLMKLNITPSVLDEWQKCEQASWEDAHSPKEGHVYNVLSRHKTIIEVRSIKEAALLIKSAYFLGDTTGLDPSLVSTHRAIGRLGDMLIRAYGMYYRYPEFRSNKTGEFIPDPTKDGEPKIQPETGLIPSQLSKKLDELEGKYTLKELQQMAREKGISPTGTKRDILGYLFVKHAEIWGKQAPLIIGTEDNLLKYTKVPPSAF